MAIIFCRRLSGLGTIEPESLMILICSDLAQRFIDSLFNILG